MSRFNRRAGLGAMAALLLAPAARAHHQGGEGTAGAIRVETAWTRAMRAGGSGVGYMVIRNTGATPDRLVAARTPASQVVELHTHIRDGDIMRMRPVEAIELPPGGEVRLEPGGLHLMLIGLRDELRQGGQVPVTLVFERAGEAEIRLLVEPAGARGPAGHGHGAGHGHRH